jgi:hypothetical protein
MSFFDAVPDRGVGSATGGEVRRTGYETGLERIDAHNTIAVMPV